MWSSVEEDFAKILSTRVFHTLADDSGYVEIFRRAGFKGKLPTDLSQAPAASKPAGDQSRLRLLRPGRCIKLGDQFGAAGN